MRIQLFFLWILHFMDLARGADNTNILRYRRSSSVARLCPAGCASCSALNGCLSCKPRLFFHLELDGMRQRGTCLSSCPRGHYDKRSPQFNTCTRCREDCAFCFSETFCTRCHPDHFLFRGKCGNSCPNGLTANTALRECTECPAGCEVCVKINECVRCQADLYFLHGQCHHNCPSGSEPDVQLMQCTPQVQFGVGEWTKWGPCIQKKSLRANRRGEETRTRQLPRSTCVGDRCPHVSEIRKCVIKKRPSGLS
ncbi:R-spondin-3-like [Limanda limanda]|uniref:R-spondin-3-like n=1 Tax=Limanda limanda TaxID=27771 RepID=UPI0029C7BD87|nr:R-spondin-3-like [Limanda limanda]